MSGESTPFRTKKLMSESESGGSLPIGSVIHWAGIGQENNGVISYDIPDNWKVANGQALDKDEFSSLFAKIGHRFDNDAITVTNLKAWMADIFNRDSVDTFERNDLDNNLKLIVDGNGTGSEPINILSIIANLKKINFEDTTTLSSNAFSQNSQLITNLLNYFSPSTNVTQFSFTQKCNALFSQVSSSNPIRTALYNLMTKLYPINYTYNNNSVSGLNEVNTSNTNTFSNYINAMIASNSLIALRFSYYYSAIRYASYNYNYYRTNYNTAKTAFLEHTSFANGKVDYYLGKGNGTYSGVEEIRKTYESQVKDSTDNNLKRLYIIIIATILLLEESLKGNLINSVDGKEYSKLGEEKFFAIPNLIDYYIKGGSNVGTVANATGTMGSLPNIKATFGCVDPEGNGYTNAQTYADSWESEQNSAGEAITVSKNGIIGHSSGWLAYKYKAVIDASKGSPLYSNNPLATIEPSHVDLIPLICVK